MGFSSVCIFILYAQLFIQISSARVIYDIPKNDHDEQSTYVQIYGKQEVNDFDPAVKVFFHVQDLYSSKKMPIYFAVNDPLTTPRFLAKEHAELIPFSSLKLPFLLNFMSISEDSPQAKAMEQTIKQCELEPTPGETRFCASSLESLLDMTRGILGMVKLKTLTTKIHDLPNSNHTYLQEYTFLKEPLEIHTSDIVACHTMAYPYAVFYCHSQKGYNRVFEISLGGENGNRVDAIAVCHMNTTMWDADHVAFRVLGGHPGSSPVCHFLPTDNVVWIPAP
ncbi:BURP domain-containing protein BNM2A-like [Rutidosis leptorrhynchoides]|uniref:BURP domain-containing protein BNM2A-like n=1 Tax=Rutidosis leptorrhynchoides TaxID=125765 RepID=UPI003A9941D0